MKKRILSVLILFMMAFAVVMAQGLPSVEVPGSIIQDDIDHASQVASTAAYPIPDPVEGSEAPAEVTEAPQEGEPAESTLYRGLALLAIVGIFALDVKPQRNATAKRRARTLLFQPKAT